MIATIPMILPRINLWKFGKLGSDLSWVADLQIWGDVFRWGWNMSRGLLPLGCPWDIYIYIPKYPICKEVITLLLTIYWLPNGTSKHALNVMNSYSPQPLCNEGSTFSLQPPCDNFPSKGICLGKTYPLRIILKKLIICS